MSTLELAQEIEDYVIKIRREIHENPELSGEEFETQKLIIEQLESFGIPYNKVGNTSTIAYVKGIRTQGNNDTIAFRADIDALPMKEETDVSFKSRKENIAHMCGHDAHTAILLGVAKLLQENNDKFSGTIKLFFQEAEERTSGANKIIEADGLKDVKMIFALHCLEAFKVGEVSIASGYQLSGQDSFRINWTGVSGHAATPQKANDSLQAAAVFVADLQAAVNKVISPLDTAVVSCGVFHAGTASNIISKHAKTNLTFRYYKEDVRKAIHESVSKHASCIGEMYGVNVDVNIKQGVPPLYNDEVAVDYLKNAFNKVNGFKNIIDHPPLLSSEDFALYLQHVPGAMGWLGIGNEEIEAIYYPHHDRWKIDENALKYGVAWLFQCALDYYNK